MRIRLRLAHLLGLDRDGHIPVKQLAESMGITRHQLTHLLDNNSPTINRHILEAVTEYLVGHGLNPTNLVEQLFVFEPDEFWPMLAGRQRIDINIGVRWRKAMGWDQLVVAADNVLQSVLVNRLTGVAAEKAEKHRSRTRLQRHAHQVINSELALSWGYHGSSVKEIQAGAMRLFRRFAREQNDKAIICLGSIKSNPMCEPVIANGFSGAKAFRSEDGVASVADRNCPFVMIYRGDDPNPASCWGGLQLGKSDRKAKPGIYYEREPGIWQHAFWGALDDVALVYYRYLEGPGNLEMVLGGFSGRSTRCLAEMLRTGVADSFWPPCVETSEMKMGAFIVEFGFRQKRRNEGINVRSHDRRNRTTVIPIPKECLEPRLAMPHK